MPYCIWPPGGLHKVVKSVSGDESKFKTLIMCDDYSQLVAGP